MIFTTFTFAVFFPTVLALYWALGNRRAQNGLLVVASYFFYGWWDYRYCALMLISSLIDYGVGRGLGRTDSPRRRRLLLLLSVASNLGILGFFKYYDFFADSAQRLATSLGYPLTPFTLGVVLPVGISFYTFQSLGYSIDVYRREVEPCDDLLDFLAFVSFFPQLVAGPIERAGNLLPQIGSDRRFDRALAADGCRQMLWGAFKKAVIADNLALVVDAVYTDPAAHTGPQLALATVCFAFQIYCDFSGYSDIAIGCAKVFGIRLMRNFAYPYFSRSLSEFWLRWHISLSTWFRDYVYVPLGGNRRGPLRRDFNALAAFLLSGLWHGAAWKFVLWGGVHGAGVVGEMHRRRRRRHPPPALPGGPGWMPRPGAALAMALTFAFVCLGWVLFRARTLGDAVLIYEQLALGSWGAGRWRPVLDTAREHLVPLLSVVVLVAVEWLRRAWDHPLYALDLRPRWWRWTLYTLIVLLILQFAPARGREFIYFQF